MREYSASSLPSDYSCCQLCPRMCGVDRRTGTGFCGCSHKLMAARAALHQWEEPCVSGPEYEPGGSGTVFFSGCTLRCCFCQNFKLSSECFGKELTKNHLADVFLRLQDEGAHNINLVTATQFLPTILAALDLIRHRLTIPVVYNCGGYERVQTVRALKGYVDVWLPDFKYFDNQLALKYSRAGDYFEIASAAISQMISQTGAPVFQMMENSNGPYELIKKGVIIRHMVLPVHRDDSIRLLIAEYLSLFWKICICVIIILI